MMIFITVLIATVMMVAGVCTTTIICSNETAKYTYEN